MALRDRLPPAPRAWELREIAIRVCLLPFAFAPDRVRRAAAKGTAAVLFRGGSGSRESWPQAIPEPIVAMAGMSAVEAAREAEARRRHDMILGMRGIVWPKTRRRLTVDGFEHVSAALERGGVILWTAQCVSSDVAVKQAMFERGHPVVQLSRPSHPFSDQPFGERFVNPLLRRAEDVFLAERVVIEGERSVAPLRRLRAVLVAGGTISITVTPQATGVELLPFLGGTLRLANGPVELAASTGAVLIPVFVSGPPNSPTVQFGPPLPAGRSAGDVRAAHDGFARWLGARIEEDPLAWAGWRGYTWTRRGATTPGRPGPPAVAGSP